MRLHSIVSLLFFWGNLFVVATSDTKLPDQKVALKSKGGNNGLKEKKGGNNDFGKKNDNFDYGKIVIVLSLGRSGSTWLCDVISNIAGEKIDLVVELFGGNKVEMTELKDPLKVMISYLKAEREKHAKGYIGFKWKPLYSSAEYIKCWHWLVSKGAKIVYSTRNPLDMYLSSLKHQDSDVKAHCEPTDKKCLSLHLQARVTADIPIMLKSIKTDSAQYVENYILLDSLKANFIDVSYDKLTWGTDEKKLQHLQVIIDFLFPNSKTIANMQHFVTEEALTSNALHSSTIENYDAVLNTLTGTRFISLLRTHD
jgi:hypothetical protein